MRLTWIISGVVHAGALAGMVALGVGRIAEPREAEAVIITSRMSPELPEQYSASRFEFAAPECQDPQPELPAVESRPEDAARPVTEPAEAARARVEIDPLVPAAPPSARQPDRPRHEPRHGYDCPCEPVAASSRPAPTPPQPAAGNLSPRYPTAARHAGIEGVVQVTLRISERGEVESAEVAISSGNRQLDEAALAALRLWKFAPATADGREVPFEVVIPVRFALRSRQG